MDVESTIINLGCLVSEHATKPKNKDVYIDVVKVFLNTLDFYYIPKHKIDKRIEELQQTCKVCRFRGNICKDFEAFNQCTVQLTIKNLQDLINEEE